METSEFLPRLNTATTFEGETDVTAEEVHVSYKTGASFVGKIHDHKKIGRGVFTWPNGARYEGEFADNLRNGKGKQIWPDGSYYEGDFVTDLRHGEGHIKWANGESYKGTFYQDRRHGKGTYTWPADSSYVGTFYMDKKEGYGSFKFANGDKFEGLYIGDEREGPGVKTYQDGRQDVGLWLGEKLIKLCSESPDAFKMKNHQEFDFNPEEHILYIDPNETTEQHNTFNGVISPPSVFDYLPESTVPERVTELFSEALDPRSLAVNKEAFNQEFFKDETVSDNNNEKIVAWNKTPSMILLQKSVHKHRNNEYKALFKVDSITQGDRSNFKDKGPLELASEDLLQAAMSGDAQKVEDLLTSGLVHADVADRNGHTALIGATVNWHIDIINILLNHGANVNKLNDEGCSALSAGIIFFYPVDSFRYNIAELYLEKPPEVEDGEKVEDQPKGILSNKTVSASERKLSQVNLVNRQKSSQSPGKMVAIVPSGFSSTSIDSGVPPTDSMQSFRHDKSQVKISEADQIPKHQSEEMFVQESEKDSNSYSDVKDKDKDSMIDSGNEDNGILDEDERTLEEEFESNISVRDYQIEVTDQLLERCATQLSTNERVVSRESRENSAGLGTARLLAIQISLQEQMKKTLDLLLRRGADPNASGIPIPVLFFAIKAADVEMVKTLLMKGASTGSRLPKEKGGLAPLHITCAIPGEEGVQITELLLNALADPDVRAMEDDSFLNCTLEEEWIKDAVSEESKAILGGRTPLQIACARDDNYKHACRVVHLLLEHKANTNLLCNGFSSLALAIASGNDLAVDELLAYGADPSLPLTHGVGSALCVATSTEYEHRRSINCRVQLVDKLIRGGANILAPIAIGTKRITGTAVDYAYYMFNQDRRIAHMPYHALTHAERETYNARRKLLGHIGDIMRTKSVMRERTRLEEEARQGLRSTSPSAGFMYVGAGAPLPPGVKSKAAIAARAGQVTFDPESKYTNDGKVAPEGEAGHGTRKPLFKYCYECGRSVGVRLSACTRCKEVYYCSKACKLKAWNARHKEECIRLGGRSRSPSPATRKGRIDSPTPTTNAERGRKTTVAELTKDKRSLRIVVPVHGLSQSAKGTRSKPGGKDRYGRLVKSGGPTRNSSPPHNVYIDNYSYV